MSGKRISRRTNWTVTAKPEETMPTGVRLIPVYKTPERRDGKPSINTPEGWERYRVKCMIRMRLLEMMQNREAR